MQSHVAVYQGVEATTAEPARLVLLLFDGAARFLRQGPPGPRPGGTAPAKGSRTSRAGSAVEASTPWYTATWLCMGDIPPSRFSPWSGR